MMWPQCLRSSIFGAKPKISRSAEVVELHRALEVVEAVERELDRAADRAAGVVDRCRRPCSASTWAPRSGRSPPGPRCRRRRRRPAAPLRDAPDGLVELGRGARGEDHRRAGRGELLNAQSCLMPEVAPVTTTILLRTRGEGLARACSTALVTAPVLPPGCPRGPGNAAHHVDRRWCLDRQVLRRGAAYFGAAWVPGGAGAAAARLRAAGVQGGRPLALRGRATERRGIWPSGNPPGAGRAIGWAVHYPGRARSRRRAVQDPGSARRRRRTDAGGAAHLRLHEVGDDREGARRRAWRASAARPGA